MPRIIDDAQLSLRKQERAIYSQQNPPLRTASSGARRGKRSEPPKIQEGDLVGGLKVLSPKRETDTQTSKSQWFNFYAGYSFDFAESIIRSANLNEKSLILDPWNGSGTTTTAAAHCGFDSKGFDRNPAMIVAAKARLVSHLEKNALNRIAKSIARSSDKLEDVFPEEPLTLWFSPRTAGKIRSLERSVTQLTIGDPSNQKTDLYLEVSSFSPSSAFYLLAIFNVVRNLMTSFRASNPTWVKKARENERLDVPDQVVSESFEKEVENMLASLSSGTSWLSHPMKPASIELADSRNLPLENNIVDLTVTSPPYCTRIDYAVATSPELAVLGLGNSSIYDTFRRELIGTTAIRSGTYAISKDWGKTCKEFIETSKAHTSKASSTYYYKSHLQYFHALHESIAQIHKVTKPEGRLIAVVQDSFYKDVHNDLAKIFSDMSINLGFEFTGRRDFNVTRLLSGVNPKAKRYLEKRSATESVLTFKKPNHARNRNSRQDRIHT